MTPPPPDLAMVHAHAAVVAAHRTLLTAAIESRDAVIVAAWRAGSTAQAIADATDRTLSRSAVRLVLDGLDRQVVEQVEGTADPTGPAHVPLVESQRQAIERNRAAAEADQ